MKASVVAVMLLVAAGAATDVAGPTAADFAACNMAAAADAAADTPATSPRTTPPESQGRPGAPPSSGLRNDVATPPSPSGKAGAAGVTRDPTGDRLPGAGDPRREGVAADRVGDPQYVAAYEACMRRKGF